MKYMNIILLLLVSNVIIAMEAEHKSLAPFVYRDEKGSMVAVRYDASDKQPWRVDKEMQFSNQRKSCPSFLKSKNFLRSVRFDDTGKKIIAMPTQAECSACIWDRDGKELERLDHDALDLFYTYNENWFWKLCASGNYPWIDEYEEDVAKLLEKRFGFGAMMCKNEEQAFVVPNFRVHNGRQVHAWDKANNKILFTLNHYDTVQSVDFHPNGTEIITTSSDKTVRLWDKKTGKELVCIGYDTRFSKF